MKRRKLSNCDALDYTIGVIDGLEWCLNCGSVVSARDIIAKIRELKGVQDDTLDQMEKEFNRADNSGDELNSIYDIIVAQILDAFPNACEIVRRGMFKESVIVEFKPYSGATVYSATLFKDYDKVFIAMVV